MQIVPYDTRTKVVVSIKPKRIGQSDVDAFLSEVRIAIDERRCIFQGTKKKNRDTLVALGLNTEEVYKEIASLTYADYCYGPEPDNRSKYADEEIWVFKKKVDWFTIYVKLKFAEFPEKKLVVLSFHEDNAQ